MSTRPCQVNWCSALAADGSEFCPVHRKYPELRRRNPLDARQAHRAELARKKRVARTEEIAQANARAKDLLHNSRGRGVG